MFANVCWNLPFEVDLHRKSLTEREDNSLRPKMIYENEIMPITVFHFNDIAVANRRLVYVYALLKNCTRDVCARFIVNFDLRKFYVHRFS